MALLPTLLQQAFGPSGEPPARDLDFLEIFAGDGAVSAGLRAHGYTGWSLDVRYNEGHDLLLPEGFGLLLQGVMRLRPGGLLWAAPPCSTWVFVSSGSTGRNAHPEGNPESFYVRSQNALVCRLLLCTALARSRGVCFIWEQPANSTMLSRYQPVLEFANAAPDIMQVQLEMGCYGLAAPKDTTLWGNAPYLPLLRRRLTALGRACMRLRPDRAETTVVYMDAQGEKRCQGG